jgi:outer membrane receptor protein involved in Fe transport
MNKNFFTTAVISALCVNAIAEETVTTGTIDVFSVAPLPGIGIEKSILPSAIQEINIEQVKEQAGVSIADYLVNNAPGVSVTEVGGNPWQPEIKFRGYTAGSIAGNEQGISVYVDGVRENQPFSDVVLWDTLPSFAYESAQVIPGSNPIYGLNTLGGAVSFQTKSGRSFTGSNAEFTAGSWGRQISLLEHGGTKGKIDYYAGYQHTTERGWRDFSPNHLNQFFSKLGYENDLSRLELSYTAADNALIGNGLAPKYLLGSDNEGVNTVPDFTGNMYHKLNLSASHFHDDDTLFTGNIYWKRSDRNTWNGDAEIELDADNLAKVAGTISVGGDTIKLFRYTEDEIDEIEGENRTTHTKQDKYGLATQVSFTQPLVGYENNLTVGVSADTSLVSFLQMEYEGAPMTSERRLVKGAGEQETNTNLSGRTKTFGLYALDTISFNDQWHLTAGARYNYSEVDNVDKRSASAQAEGSLTEVQSWGRVNPTVGLTYRLNEQNSTYVSYGESNRAPTSIEMGCSNPEIACTLPTQMADDPPLDDVVAKTFEFGFRTSQKDLDISGALYRAVNHDDLQFINTNAQNGLGYFDNIGKTIRQGLDLTVGGNNLLGIKGTEKFSWTASYGYLDATYDSDLQLVSDANDSRVTTTASYGGIDEEALWSDSADALTELGAEVRDLLASEADGSVLEDFGDALAAATDEDDIESALETLEAAGVNIGLENSIINVKKGDRLANLPKNNFKLRLNYNFLPNLRVGTSLIAFTDSYMMGNENNDHGGTNGDGKVPGYTIINMNANYQINDAWNVSLKAINLLDKTYYTGGRLLMNGFTGVGSAKRDDVYRGEGMAPGSPQAAWLTVLHRF